MLGDLLDLDFSGVSLPDVDWGWLAELGSDAGGLEGYVFDTLTGEFIDASLVDPSLIADVMPEDMGAALDFPQDGAFDPSWVPPAESPVAPFSFDAPEGGLTPEDMLTQAATPSLASQPWSLGVSGIDGQAIPPSYFSFDPLTGDVASLGASPDSTAGFPGFSSGLSLAAPASSNWGSRLMNALRTLGSGLGGLGAAGAGAGGGLPLPGPVRSGYGGAMDVPVSAGGGGGFGAFDSPSPISYAPQGAVRGGDLPAAPQVSPGAFAAAPPLSVTPGQETLGYASQPGVPTPGYTPQPPLPLSQVIQSLLGGQGSPPGFQPISVPFGPQGRGMGSPPQMAPRPTGLQRLAMEA